MRFLKGLFIAFAVAFVPFVCIPVGGGLVYGAFTDHSLPWYIRLMLLLIGTPMFVWWCVYGPRSPWQQQYRGARRPNRDASGHPREGSTYWNSKAPGEK
jgi:hypothetical protein